MLTVETVLKVCVSRRYRSGVKSSIGAFLSHVTAILREP